MEIKRKAYRQLLDWKRSSPNGKAILVKGARRVGKSYLVEAFARNEYRSHILVDFSSLPPGILGVFKQYANKFSMDEFFNQLSVRYATPLHPGKSAIIFDEVQQYPKAREFIKHLVADGRYDCMETGSLISLRKNVRGIVIPSEEDVLELFPLDFEEFLGALGDTTTIDCLKSAYEQKKPLGRLLQVVNRSLRTYMLVGGMPQAVVRYAESRNYDAVERVKQGIIRLYREDIAKYAETYAAQARAVFDAIPAQLSRHDKKIKFSALHKGGRFSRYQDALYWIQDSMVGNLCYGLNEPTVFDGFSLQMEKVKCYMADTGLLLTLAAGANYLKSGLYREFISGKLAVNKGMMTENLVAQMLTASRHQLRFFEKTERSAQRDARKYEVDFLLTQGDGVTPVEVKSGNVKRHPSLDYLTAKFKGRIRKGIVLTKGDLRETDDYLYLPLAMTFLL
ncbi:MAG: ATP-binding protein [Desulfovibrio sp.]|nr:ATP-binding protein [Desulfovibrio sp.]